MGGKWINLGPLLYHFEGQDDTIEFTLEEIKGLVQRYGFRIDVCMCIRRTFLFITNPLIVFVEGGSNRYSLCCVSRYNDALLVQEPLFRSYQIVELMMMMMMNKLSCMVFKVCGNEFKGPKRNHGSR